MKNPKHKTLLVTKEEAKLNLQWFLLDASGKTLGRLATEIAKILRGKHKPTYTPHVDAGDGVIIINAEKVEVTGGKEARKIYRYYSGGISGLREIPYRTMKARKPEYLIWHAVKGMMPKTRLGEAQFKKLRVFAGEKHDLEAQQPIPVNI
ncbi:MAG TPA: 50S ribosomal protein L13 [Rhabdochlamydiaceae bacterium]|nr:50S ribosomal protein L13 [Rhabdochlamydiaceae bacterium]